MSSMPKSIDELRELIRLEVRHQLLNERGREIHFLQKETEKRIFELAAGLDNEDVTPHEQDAPAITES
jgi:hypothetical protein